MLVLSFSLVTAVPAAAADITVGLSGDYTTIQAAIDAASPGDTIIVADGTYTEDLTVNTANLTIRSVNGSASTTIQLVDGVGIDLQGGASGFTLGGAAGQGFIILSGAVTTFMIQLANAPSDVEISYNAINTTGNASMGISIGAAGATGLTISNNTFVAEAGDGSIWGPKMVNVAVSDNTFTGPGGPPDSGYAIEFAGVTATSSSAISENTITGYGMGIAIFNGEGTSDLTISGNTITGCKNGIRLGQYSPSTNGDMDAITITQNTLSTNTIGLVVNNGDNVLARNFAINYNNFTGNTDYGLKNEHISEYVPAGENWWGDISGPKYEGTGDGDYTSGTGDKITDNVDYIPWLTREFETVLADNIAYYGIPMIWLNTGWNTFSTPFALDPGCDTWEEYVALGDGFTIDTEATAYYFDGENQVYGQVTGSYQLKPCDAIYIKMAEPDTAAILLSPNVSVSSKELYAGWNLVSLAYLPFEDVPVLPVNEALATVYTVTGDLTGYSLVVNPPVNWWFLEQIGGSSPPELWSYFWRDGADPPVLYITQGYWVFMINDGTLAGFSSTPIPLMPK